MWLSCVNTFVVGGWTDRNMFNICSSFCTPHTTRRRQVDWARHDTRSATPNMFRSLVNSPSSPLYVGFKCGIIIPFVINKKTKRGLSLAALSSRNTCEMICSPTSIPHPSLPHHRHAIRMPLKHNEPDGRHRGSNSTLYRPRNFTGSSHFFLHWATNNIRLAHPCDTAPSGSTAHRTVARFWKFWVSVTTACRVAVGDTGQGGRIKITDHLFPLVLCLLRYWSWYCSGGQRSGQGEGERHTHTTTTGRLTGIYSVRYMNT